MFVTLHDLLKGDAPPSHLTAPGGRPAGFPWMQVAGQVWGGWIVIDVDASLVECHSDKQGAAPDELVVGLFLDQ
ncbi:hypothetical protein [Sphaerisporangium perillae]|uniref:hypothetical protein n=1 Tax=Sphaerisporangium perillae TaxID=2935860 RepID=UPI00200EF8DD|nr:hypothetical protein [Sphaerisporangium perillae]